MFNWGIKLFLFAAIAAIQARGYETNGIANLLSQAANEMYPNIVWGQFTNGIRAGVYLRETRMTGNNYQSLRPQWLIYPVFEADSTNRRIFWLAPQKSWTVNLISPIDARKIKKRTSSMFGNEMVIGAKGLQDSGFVFTLLDSNCPSIIGKGIVVTDLFVVKTPGDYLLNVKLCGMVVTNNAISPIYFSPIMVKLPFYE